MPRGMCFASAALSAAWDHNPQLVYHAPGYVNWGALAWIGAAWFTVAAGPTAALLATIVLVARRWRGRV